MGRIGDTFDRLRKKGEKALIAYIMAGDPSLQETERLVLEIEAAGADLIELGIPFSDPVADGPTIQKAAVRALAGGTTLRKVVDLVRRIRPKVSIPIILMTYFNPIVKYGEDRFVREAGEAGVDGLIIPDLIPDEGRSFMASAREAGLDTICLLAPTSTPERIRFVGGLSSGFIYYVSITGITGASLNVASDIGKRIRRISKESGKPVCVGFGVSTPEEAGRMAALSDGVIVGSAIVKQIEQGRDVRAFVASLKAGMKGPG